MSLRLEKIRILSGGYCLQNRYFSGQRSVLFRKFHATFLHCIHPIHGEVVIDTGYGPKFLETTSGFPERLYRWTTPVWGQSGFRSPDFFSRHGINGSDVSQVFLSHFHADHIAGLEFYPNARIVCRENAIDHYRNGSRITNMKQGFLPALLPGDFERRSHRISEKEFQPGPGPLRDFLAYDYWQDGTLLLVDLPGHAPGHTGFLLTTEADPVFYVADAWWDVAVFRAGRSLPGMARLIQYDYELYLDTQRKIRVLLDIFPCIPFASHCDKNPHFESTP